MTPKQINAALLEGSVYAQEHGRPDRNRIVMLSGTVMDAVHAYVEDGLLKVTDTNGACIFIDPQSVVLVANALMPTPQAEIDIQQGDLKDVKQ